MRLLKSLVIDTAHRYRHDRIFNKIIRTLNFRKYHSLLDIGCSYQKRYYKFFSNLKMENLDIDKSASPTYVMDIQKEVPKKKYDVITAFQVLEHIPEIDLAIRNIAGILNPKGVFIASIPMFHTIHGIDYNRYTDRALKFHFSKFFYEVRVIQYGNPVFYFLKCVSHVPIVGVPFNFLGPLLEKIIIYDSKLNPSGYFIIAKGPLRT